MLNRTDWVLLFLGLPGGPYETDQIRVMKGLFLFSQEGPPEVRQLYNFQPYDYGPFDMQIYRDLESLESQGLISVEAVENTNRRLYRVTNSGINRLTMLMGRAPTASLMILKQIKHKISSLSFLDVLRDVYERYPTYAAKSVLTK